MTNHSRETRWVRTFPMDEIPGRRSTRLALVARVNRNGAIFLQPLRFAGELDVEGRSRHVFIFQPESEAEIGPVLPTGESADWASQVFGQLCEEALKRARPQRTR